jgi:uncharacterized protein YigE (DUF2233 family)
VTSPPENGWQALAPGIERREFVLPTASQSRQGRAILLRFDPALVTFLVRYSPGEPYSLAQWHDLLPQASVIVNGGFFNELDQALGLLISDGAVYGQSFVGFGGMFQVSVDGVRVRSLITEPYQGEPLLQAVQAFPMLIEVGGVQARQGDGFDQRARRTWIGQDWSGRIVLGITHNLISLTDLQQWLVDTNLDLYVALALDGGRSTGLYVDVPGFSEKYEAIDRLPSIIAVYTP